MGTVFAELLVSRVKLSLTEGTKSSTMAMSWPEGMS